jgi:PAS domain S-box-containing protein
MADKFIESFGPKDQPDPNALGALLELARAFAPSFSIGLPKLVATPPVSSGAASQEERIRKIEARYRTLVEQIPAVTFMASFENGLSEIYVSPHIETLLGYTAREWIDNPILWYQRLHPLDRSRWNKEFSRTVSWAEPFKADYRFLAKNGRTVWIHGEAKVVRDASGRPSFVQGIGYDITEQKEAERKFRTLLESAPDAMVIVNQEGRIVLVNSQTEKLFGYPRAELLDQLMEILVPGLLRNNSSGTPPLFFAQASTRSMGTGIQLYGLRKDGTEFPVEINLSPLETDAGMLVSSAIRDITDRIARPARAAPPYPGLHRDVETRVPGPSFRARIAIFKHHRNRQHPDERFD